MMFCTSVEMSSVHHYALTHLKHSNEIQRKPRERCLHCVSCQHFTYTRGFQSNSRSVSASLFHLAMRTTLARKLLCSKCELRLKPFLTCLFHRVTWLKCYWFTPCLAAFGHVGFCETRMPYADILTKHSPLGLTAIFEWNWLVLEDTDTTRRRMM